VSGRVARALPDNEDHVMGSAKFLLAGLAATAFFTTAARGADLAYPLPPPPPDFGGWYLRGDIGMSNQRVNHLFNALYLTPGTSVQNISKGFDSGWTYGIGAGYQFNHWARADITGEYRGKTNFRGLDTYSPEPASGTGIGVDDYYASKSEWLFLANFYVDLGTWWGLTPFVGAGLGTSRNTIHDFRDVNVATNGLAYGTDASKWNFAWAVHAGVGYAITPNVMLELAYRYVNLGDAQSGDLITYSGVNNVVNPMEFHSITSHDIRLGVRWMLDVPPPSVGYVPIISKG
jgi:opacity protein-like surface antigen